MNLLTYPQRTYNTAMRIQSLATAGEIGIFFLLVMMSTQGFIARQLKKSASGIMIAHLADEDKRAFESIRKVFALKNPGYQLDYLSGETSIKKAANAARIVFIQTGETTATLTTGESSKVSVGDIVLLRVGEGLTTDSALNMLMFTAPDAPPADIPSFVRPDWDPNITDTPGGCATETNAYRRILLTWLDKVGKYRYHHLNAHRVRIMDSFSHYHPEEGGFDEFYLVQMVLPGAKLLTSNQVSLIERPDEVTPAQAKGLIFETPLAVGDLVYIPRGVMHRGVGGVLAQVITVPGFVPGSEIGVDHHLRKISERLNGENTLPYNVDASAQAVVK
ncbi:MAG: hypothetical protein SF052_25710 [Bacteroidia bacterium]|nr:hypothetical protein [Bacteroidia bacterium]